MADAWARYEDETFGLSGGMLRAISRHVDGFLVGAMGLQIGQEPIRVAVRKWPAQESRVEAERQKTAG